MIEPLTCRLFFCFSPQIDVTFSPESAYLDVYQNQTGQYFTNNLTDEIFQNVQDADAMLLHDVDTANELNNLPQIQVCK